MIKTFTQDDLVRYIYQETTIEENIEIEQALLFDKALISDYEELMTVSSALDELGMEPSQNTINSILKYSKSYTKQLVDIQLIS
jgi:hypothetical protein